MDFKLTEEQELMLESVRELCAGFPEAYWQECDVNNRIPTEFMKAYADSGLNTLGLPEELGGIPVDNMTIVLARIEMGRMGVPVFACGTGLSTIHMIKEYGTPEQMKICIEKLKAGEHVSALASTEAGSGSNTAGLATNYERIDGGKILINGSKTFITNCGVCEYMTVIARCKNPENPKKVFTAFWIPTNTPGVSIEHMQKIGQNYTRTCNVYLDNVVVDESTIIGKEGNAFLQLMKGFENERLMMCANTLGPAIAAYEDAAAYACERELFNERIGEFQMIQLKLVDMKTKIENMKNMTYKTAWMMDEGLSIKSQAAMAKRYCVQTACEVIDDAMQIFGGIGYMTDHRISRFWRDARFFRLGGGTDEVMTTIVGKEILKEFSK